MAFRSQTSSKQVPRYPFRAYVKKRSLKKRIKELESLTSGLEDQRSNQLSYIRIFALQFSYKNIFIYLTMYVLSLKLNIKVFTHYLSVHKYYTNKKATPTGLEPVFKL